MPTLLDTARRLVTTAIAAVDPERLVREELARRDTRFDAVLAVGKAAAAMARGARELIAPKKLLIRPHSSPALLDPGWEQKTGGHPLPDRQSLAAGERLRDWLEGIAPEQSLLALVSGGASACLELPHPGFALQGVIEAHRLLLASGLPIGEVNAARKELSALKGGGALRFTKGRVLALLLSDVPGDDPGTIASGLFADPAVENVVIGSVRLATAAVAAAARKQGFSVAEGELTGEAARAGRELVARGRALEGPAVALVLGGETTVTVLSGDGRGGRNGELALAAARELASGARGLPGQEEVVLSLATDGEDGTTGTAGAAVEGGIEGSTWEAIRRAGIDPEAALARHDSLPALEKAPGALLRTGVTGTNVGDLAIYLRRTCAGHAE
ncbi:MAG TPA: DUF4147 domain-containing protein [Thermoanaerobaculia bacterium]|nr:DUF4147 domain-containing protein [Thermoanaerobaculia bacterium]